VDRAHYTVELRTRQEFRSGTNPSELQQHETLVSPEDRRLLLGASRLRLLGRRFSCGKTILQADVVRMALLADDVTEHAA
jgi:hypothetical protein